jgi:nitroreductase
LDANEAIRLRRSVRQYTDRPVPDADLDAILRLALLAPNGGGAQAWSLLVVRDPEQRRQMAELVIDGGAKYFEVARRPAEGRTPEEHRAWARQYADTGLASYHQVPVWVAGLVVPRAAAQFPEEWRKVGDWADVSSVGFAMENLFVAARARGLGTVATVFHLFEEQRFRALLDLPPEVQAPIITPLGYPVEFPKGLPPAIAKQRRPWRSLVHDDRWGNPRAPEK